VPGPGWPLGAVIELVEGAKPPPGFMLIGTYERELKPVAAPVKSKEKEAKGRVIKLQIFVYQKTLLEK
jgi:hypothetical protein